jgi:multiple sugar transport system ATP-binding protein
MNKGKIRQVGTPREIYQWPADTFVATFVGSPPMNLLGEGNILTGFRPETFLPAGVLKDGDEAASYDFEVTWMEYLGAERLIYGNVGEKSHARHVVARLPGNVTLPIHAGETYPFAVPVTDLRYFERVSGLRTERGPR